jgi:hypothetical protein
MWSGHETEVEARESVELATKEDAVQLAHDMQKNMPRDVTIVDMLTGEKRFFTSAELRR